MISIFICDNVRYSFWVNDLGKSALSLYVTLPEFQSKPSVWGHLGLIELGSILGDKTKVSSG